MRAGFPSRGWEPIVPVDFADTVRECRRQDHVSRFQTKEIAAFADKAIVVRNAKRALREKNA